MPAPTPFVTSFAGVVIRVAHDLKQSDVLTPALVRLIQRFCQTQPHLSSWSASSWEEFVSHLPANEQPDKNQSTFVQQLVTAVSSSQKEIALQKFELALRKQNCSSATIRNYRSDISQFLTFCNSSDVLSVLSKSQIEQFERYQAKKGLQPSSIRRKTSSIHQLAQWLEQEQARSQGQSIKAALATAASTSEEKPVAAPVATPKPIIAKIFPVAVEATNTDKPEKKTLLPTPTPQRPPRSSFMPRWYQSLTWLSFLNLAGMILFFVGLGVLGYQQLFRDPPAPLAYPSTPTPPGRFLSFQGRLTDTAQNPITTATNMTYRLYDASTVGTQLWSSGTCSITPDQDGIFSTLLGETCGAAIGSNVFSENDEVWLEVQVAAETLTPRQRIASVAYALNAETLQGYPLSATGAATTNTILAMDGGGSVVLGETNPEIRSISGTFTLEGQSLLFQTTSGSNGDIVLDADGIGGVVSRDYFRAPGATLSATYAGGVPLTVQGGPSGTAHITNFNNNSGTTLAYIDSAGNAVINNTLGIVADTDLLSLASNALTVNGSVTATGDINSSGGVLQTNSVTRISNTGALTNISTTQFNGITYTWPGADGSSGYILSTNGSGGLSWADPALASAGSIHWSQSNGALYPKNSTVDVLFGGQASASANFKFLNNSGSGTPTASISGNLTLNSAGVISTTLNQSLQINPNGGRVGIGTTAPTALFHVSGNAGSLALGDGTNVSAFVNVQSNRTMFGYDGSNAVFQGGSTKGIRFNVNNSSFGSGTVMAIDTSGNVSIGTTTPNASNLVTISNNGATTSPLALVDTAASGDTFWLHNRALGSAGFFGLYSEDASGYRFVINGSGFMGIGTTTPTARLDILGSASTSGTLAFRGTTDPKIDILNGEALGIRTSPGGDAGLTERLTILPSGFVGIGTTAPASILDVRSSAANYVRVNSTGFLTAVSDNSGAPVLYVQGTGTADLVNIMDGATEVFTILDGGNVGIGTTVPGQALHVVGNAYFDTSAGELTIQNTGSGSVELHSSGSLVLDTAAASSIGFQVGNATLATLFNNNFGIGDTTPTAMLTVGNGDLFQVNSSGNIAAIGGVAHVLANSAGDLVLSSNGELYLSDTRTGNIALTVADTALDAGLPQGIVDAINEIYGTAVGNSLWSTGNGALYPANSTVDVLFGGQASASANFAFLNNSGSGTPTASISGNVTLNHASGAIQSTNNRSLTLGGDTTGNIIMMPANGSGGRIAVGTTTPEGFAHLFRSSSTRGYSLDGNDMLVLEAFGTNRIKWVSGNTAHQILSFSDQDSEDMGVISYMHDIDAMGFATNGTTAMRINSSQNIGIGTTTINNRLQIAGGDVFINAQGDMRFGDADSTNYAAIQAPATLGGNYTLTLPDDDGTSGQVLSTDGSGVLSWTGVATLANIFWYQGNGALYPANSTVDVLFGGQASSSANFAFINNSGSGTPTASISGNLTLNSAGQIQSTRNQTLTIGGSSTGDIILSPRNSSGNVGINTTSATHALTVQGPGVFYPSGVTPDNTYNGSLRITQAAASGQYINLVRASNYPWSLGTVYNTSNFAIGAGTASDASFTSPFFVIENTSGDVGIGSTAPVADLDVVGAFFLRNVAGAAGTNFGVEFNTSSSLPRVDFVHNGTYVGQFSSNATSVIFKNNLNNTGNILFQTNTNNVETTRATITNGGNWGLGTTTPIAKLQVTGIPAQASNALVILNTTGSNDILTASTSGTTRLTLSNAGDLQLYGQQDLRLADSDSTNYAAIQAPATIGTNYTLTLPDTDGDSGQVLSTDGSGALSWTGVATLSNIFWYQGNGALYPANSTVDVLFGGQSSASADIAFINLNSGTPTASISGNLTLNSAGVIATTNQQPLNIGDSNTGNINFYSDGTHLMTMRPDGNIGIGTTSSNRVLTIVDADGVSSNTQLLYLKQQNSDAGYSFNLEDASSGRLYVQGVTGGSESNIMTFDRNLNNVGIGTTAPTNVATGWGGASQVSRLWLRSTGGSDYTSLVIAGSAGGAIQFTDTSGTPTADFGTSNGSEIGFANRQNAAINFYTNGANNRMTITGAGNVGVGGDTTPDSLFSVGSTSQFQINSSGIISVIDSVAHTIEDVSGNLQLTSNSTQITLNDNIFLPAQNDLRLADSDSTNYIALQAPATVGTNVTLTLPDTAGSSGQVLSTDGTGTLSWATVATLANVFWYQGNGTLYPANSTVDLLIGGQSTASARFAVTNINGSGNVTASASGSVAGAATSITGDGTIQTTQNRTLTLGGNSTGNIELRPLNGGGSVNVFGNSTTGEFMRMIGADRTWSFVQGGSLSNSGSFVIRDTAESANRFEIDLNGVSRFDSNTTTGEVLRVLGQDRNWAIAQGGTYAPSGGIGFRDLFNDVTRMVLDGNGNVGIGTTVPLARLDVAGSASVSGNLTFNSAGVIQTTSNQTLYLGGNTTGDLHLEENNVYFGNDSILFQNQGGSSLYIDVASTITLDADNGTFQFYDSGIGVANLVNVGGDLSIDSIGGDLLLGTDGDRIGIGTTIPRANLHVYSTYGANAAAILDQRNSGGDILAASASGTTRLTLSNAGDLQLFGQQDLRLADTDSSAYAAIQAPGTIGASYTLTLPDTDGDSGQVLVSDGSGVLSWTTPVSATNLFWAQANGALYPANSTVDVLFGGQASSSANFAFLNNSGSGTPTASISGNLTLNSAGVISTTLNRSLSINPNGGNVGIGTTAPGSLLSLVTPAQDVFTTLTNGTATATFGITNSSNIARLGTTSNHSFEFITNNNQRFKVMSGGNIGFGDSSPDFNFELSGNGATTGTILGVSSDDDLDGDLFSLLANGNLGLGTTAPHADLHVVGNYGANAAVVIDQLNSGDLLTASMSGATRFRIDTNGYALSQRFIDLANSAYFLDPAATGTSMAVAGDIGINTTAPSARIHAISTAEQLRLGYDNGNYTQFTTGATGDLTLAPSGGDTSITGNLGVTGTTTFNSLTYTWPGSQTANYILQTNGSGTLSWVDPLTALGAYWQQSNGSLYPVNSTLDVFFGGQASSSANFKFLNNSGSGTPTASISGNLALNAAGTIQTTLNQTLTLGGATTGNIILNPLNGTGRLGLGTTSPDYFFEGRISSGDTVFALSDPDSAHGVTGQAQTDTFFHIAPLSSTNGGVQLSAFADQVAGAQPLEIRGITGSTAPTDYTVPMVRITGALRSGTGIADLASNDSIFQVRNNDNTPALAITGDNSIAMGTTTPPDFNGNRTNLYYERASTRATMMFRTFAGGDPYAEFVLSSPDGGASNIIFSRNDGASTELGNTWQLSSDTASDTLTFANYYLTDISGLDGSYAMQIDGVTNRTTIGDSRIFLGLMHLQPGQDTPAFGKALLTLNNTETNGDLLTASASGTTRFVIKNNGDVGIGSTIPGAKLDVAQSSTAAIGIAVDNPNSTTTFSSQQSGLMVLNTNTTNNNFARIGFNDSLTGGSAAAIAARFSDHTNDYGDLTFWTRNSGGFAERVTINQTGYLGIGSTSPGSPLSIGNTLASTGATSFIGANINPVLTGASSGLLIGTRVSPTAQPGTSNTLTSLYGLDTLAGINTAGTVTAALGVRSLAIATTGTITNSYNYYSGNGIESTGGSIGTQYGFYSESLTAGTANWGLYINSGMGNFIGGSLGIGDTTSISSGNVPAGSLVIGNGALCVDNGGDNCDDAARTAGRIYADNITVVDIDLAENYPSYDNLEAGDLVAIDQNTNEFVTRTTGSYQDTAIGVISTEPGLLLGGFKPINYNGQLYPVALTGRVPVKVSTENGPIYRGDPLTSSSKPGVAMKATQSSRIVGRALEDYTAANANQVGKIIGFVNPTHYSSDVAISSTGDITIMGNDTAPVATATYTASAGSTLISKVDAFAELAVANLRAGVIRTRQLLAEVRIQTPEVQTELISPVNDTVSVQLTDSNDRFQVTDAQDQTVVSIDNQGNTQLSGELQVQGSTQLSGNLQVEGSTQLGALLSESVTVTGDVTIAGDATVSGEITATSARLQTLESRLAEVESVRAQTAEIVNATISGTLYADTISGFDDKVATALQQPSLLAQLLAEQQPASAAASLASLYNVVDQAGYSATGSGVLNRSLEDLALGADDISIGASAVFINNYFEVNGTGYISEALGIGHDLWIGDGMHLADGSIEYISPTNPDSSVLAIQPSGRGSINLLANTLIISANGQVEVNGDLKVAGDVTVGDSLLTDLIKPTDFTNPLQVQVAGVSTESAEVKESRFEIVNEVGTPVATISAQGRASFAGGIGVGSQDLSGSQNQAETNKTSGKAVVKQGQTEMVIKSEQISAETVIQVTPQGSTNNQVLYVKSVTAENPNTTDKEGQFVVGFDAALPDKDVPFTWWILN